MLELDSIMNMHCAHERGSIHDLELALPRSRPVHYISLESKLVSLNSGF